ncbi:MAG: tRNA (adenosine(37)-N6)-threonylcarbamoyltransferase complex dimerization subunit type 1 TsaB [Blastocatellales bacterium]
MSNNHSDKDNSGLVVGIDTSSPSASFAIVKGEQTLAVLEGDASIPHSKSLFGHISDLLNLAGIRLTDVQAFAVATGPGSFTGLRVGLAGVKGLSHSLGKPAIGINSIDALALTVKEQGEILVLIEAGRKEVYAGIRRVIEDGIIEVDSDRVCTPDEVLKNFGPFLTDNTVMVSKHLSELAMKFLSTKINVKSGVITTAEAIAIRAAKIWQSQSEYPLRPHYIRASDAELNRKG